MKKALALLTICAVTLFADGGTLRNEAGEHVTLFTDSTGEPVWALADSTGALVISSIEYTPHLVNMLIDSVGCSFAFPLLTREFSIQNVSAAETLFIAFDSIGGSHATLNPSAAFSIEHVLLDSIFLFSSDTLDIEILYLD